MSLGWLKDSISKASIMRGPMLSNMCYQILTQTKWSNLDLLILDLPPGTDIQLTLIQRLSLDGIIIITTLMN